MGPIAHKFSYESMGTTWEITIWDAVDETRLSDIKNDIIKMSEDFDRTYSRFIKTSLVWQIAEKAGTYEVPDDFFSMLRLYRDLYIPSGKKLNPLIGFTIADLGYDDQYSLISKDSIRHTPDLLETVKIYENRIETTGSVLFDFGALGKGYFVDKIAAYLKSKGITRFLVDGSGDIYYSGPEPIMVGLEHPSDPSKVVGTVSMKQGSMCASGINRRRWGNHHHVIDPQASTSSEEGIVATWVIAESASLADALATCLFFVAPEQLKDYDFEYVIMNSEDRIKKSMPSLQL